MVGIVIVSHSRQVAEGVVELMHMVARDVCARAAGGLADGTLGTSFDRIMEAVEAVDTGDGCAILMDLGSAVMTSEMVAEAMEDHQIRLIDAPLVEGAVLAAAQAVQGKTLAEIEASMEEARRMRKIPD
ncbi:hypothetical protein TAMA11512_03680 [Selenomonas sp. TAMA-11512]|uniref:dihydroxyacetone kinase phosphoryl donor subunit DhaM n=1 Tax=Selenomonas sp. TAMA-11512 TaxID=3095337 RepID=UPI00308D6DFD|nr:hypothetical protein TAMA11512_03680 [Selenomonas sp. TAMA-11512]